MKLYFDPGPQFYASALGIGKPGAIVGIVATGGEPIVDIGFHLIGECGCDVNAAHDHVTGSYADALQFQSHEAYPCSGCWPQPFRG